MIVLETYNRIIEELLNAQIETYLKQEKIVKIETNIVDFDGALYQISNKHNKPFSVSIKLKFYHELEEHGIDEILRRIYGDLLVQPLEGYNVTLSFDFNSNITLETTVDVYAPIVRKIAMLKRNCIGALFERFFQYQIQNNSKKENLKRSVIHYREDETMYIEAAVDRVIVIFSTVFKDADDNVLGRVFMEIFPERRQQYQQAPQIISSYRTLPAELKNLPDVRTGENVGHLTFVLFSRHINEKTRDNTIDMIHLFRNYLHYHIKCCKAHVHAHMRRKTIEFLRRLHLARPEVKKTIRRPDSTRDQSSAGIE